MYFQEKVSSDLAQEANSNHDDSGTIKISPLVTSQVNSSAESIQTILTEFDQSLVVIPEYQRDSDQWNDWKKSLFIETILNNLTVPSFIYARHDDPEEEGLNRYEVVDGQQRLYLLQEFKQNKFRLLPSDRVNYLPKNSVHYQNKTYKDLPPKLKRIFDSYKISIIYLPESLEKSVRLETFRRLNLQPNTLSPHDIRLSQFPYSKITCFLRVVGVFDLEKQGSKRMLDHAYKHGVKWPWSQYDPEVQEAWKRWWNNKKTNLGQKASEMFLWYIIGLYYDQVDEMLKNPAHLAGELKMNFLDNVENVADLVFAQLNYEEDKGLKLLCSINELENELFPNFVRWFKFFHDQYPSTFNVQRNRLVAFMFAALYRYDPSLLQEYHINMLDKFLCRPRDTSAELGITYPETKGKWNSTKGLYNQIKGIHRIIDNIMG